MSLQLASQPDEVLEDARRRERARRRAEREADGQRLKELDQGQIREDASVCRHEAGHAAAWLMRGHMPARVVANWPTGRQLGLVEMDWTATRLDQESGRDLAVSILCGPRAAGREDWPPFWVEMWGDSQPEGDRRHLALTVRYLELDEAGYQELCRESRELAKTYEFDRLVWLIGTALEIKGELNPDELRWVVGQDTLDRYGIDTEMERADEKQDG